MGSAVPFHGPQAAAYSAYSWSRRCIHRILKITEGERGVEFIILCNFWVWMGCYSWYKNDQADHAVRCVWGDLTSEASAALFCPSGHIRCSSSFLSLFCLGRQKGPHLPKQHCPSLAVGASFWEGCLILYVSERWGRSCPGFHLPWVVGGGCFHSRLGWPHRDPQWHFHWTEGRLAHISCGCLTQSSLLSKQNN